MIDARLRPGREGSFSNLINHFVGREGSMLRILKRIDLLVGIVVVIAGVSFLLSLFVLFQPWFPLPNGINERATVSQALSVALALIVGMIAITITAGVESSEYRAQERLDGDIASLKAALASIYL